MGFDPIVDAKLIDLLSRMGVAGESAGIADVFQYLAQLNSFLAGQTFTGGLFTTTQDSLQTVLSLNGKGELVGIIAQAASVGIPSSQVRITLDGTVLPDLNGLGTTPQIPAYSGGSGLIVANPAWNIAYNYPPAASLGWEFKNSLLIQAKSDGTNTVRVAYSYNH